MSPTIIFNRREYLLSKNQTLWGTIKSDLLQLSGSLHARQLELFRLNFSEIIFLPKANEAGRIKKFRPVYLLNISFMIFTKVATIRLNTMADHVVQPLQTAFILWDNHHNALYIKAKMHI
jgi:hypothetical protein